MQKTSPPPGSDPRTVQLVAIRYTGYVIPVHRLVSVQITYWFLSGPVFEAIQPLSYVLVLSIPNLSCKQLKLGNISRIIFGLYGHNVFISSVSQLHISFISHFPVWLFKCWITNLVIHLHDYLTPKQPTVLYIAPHLTSIKSGFHPSHRLSLTTNNKYFLICHALTGLCNVNADYLH